MLTVGALCSLLKISLGDLKNISSKFASVTNVCLSEPLSSWINPAGEETLDLVALEGNYMMSKSVLTIFFSVPKFDHCTPCHSHTGPIEFCSNFCICQSVYMDLSN